MIVLRVCALGDLVVTGPLLCALEDPLLVAHGQHLELARAAGWVRAGVDADARGLHTLYGPAPDPERLPPQLRARLERGDGAVAIGGPGPERDTLCERLRELGAGEVRAVDARPPPGVHAVDPLLAASDRPAGPGVARPRIALPADVLERGREHLARAGADPDAPGIALHVGAGSAAKCWPVERWIELARDVDAPLLAVEGPADADAVRVLRDALGLPVLRGLDLVDLAAALAGVRALLGHDSGVSHLAAALGRPVLALFGPGDPACWEPRGPRTRAVRAPGGDLRALEVDAAREAVRELLD